MDNGISNLSLEAVMAMTERTIKRLWILCLVLIAFLLLSNGAWIIYESQFESYKTTEIQQDGEGVNITGNGDINYGTENKNY